jgi:hypothetical protein
MDYFDRVLAMPDTLVKEEWRVVGNLWKNRRNLAIPYKRKRLIKFFDAFYKITKKLHEGHKFSVSEAYKTDYWEYIKGYHKEWQQQKPLSRSADRQMRSKFWSGVILFYDIKYRGMKKPLDVIVEDGRQTLYRGYRRLVILQTLGIKQARVRYAIVGGSGSSK